LTKLNRNEKDVITNKKTEIHQLLNQKVDRPNSNFRAKAVTSSLNYNNYNSFNNKSNVKNSMTTNKPNVNIFPSNNKLRGAANDKSN